MLRADSHFRYGGQAQHDYDNLDPRYAADPVNLTSIIDSLEYSNQYGHKLSVINAALELAQSPGLQLNEQLDSALYARDHIDELGDRSDYILYYAHELAPMFCNYPIFETGWNNDATEEAKYWMAKYLGDIQPALANHAGKENFNEKGQTLELAAILMLGHSGLDGLRAVPSFQRQDRNNVPIDGRKYTWDVTVLSDGSTLDAGEYRLQIKADNTGSEWRRYHPDIVRIAGSQTMGLPRGDTEYLSAVTEDLCDPAYRYKAGTVLGDMTDAVLYRMIEKGPVPAEREQGLAL